MQDITENTQENAFGKFKSAEELLAAYNALEREFTKRCQLIKTLKTAGEHACAQDTDTADKTVRPPETACSEVRQSECAADSQVDKNTDDTAQEQITQAAAPTENTQSEKQPELAPCDIAAYVVANAEECAALLSEIPQVMDACIAKYKQRLIGMHCSPAVRGAAVITPVRRPKTLEEAKILADEMLR